MLYQLSYPGRAPKQSGSALLVAVGGAVQPALCICRIIGIDRLAGQAITLAEPLQKVAILAAAAAEGLVFRRRGIAAERAGVTFGQGYFS